MDKLRNFANKRFGETVLAEEAYTVAFDKLTDPAWQQTRLKSFKGTCSPQGFLFSIYRNLLEDYGRHKYGKPRPPEWVKRLGPLWVKIYKLLCLERLVPDAILSRLQTEITDNIKTFVETAVEEIRERVNHCGKKSGEVPYDFSESDDSGMLGRSNTIKSEERLDEKTLHSILSVLKVIFCMDTGSDGSDCKFKPEDIKTFSSFSLNLSPEEKLLLRMVYQDGKSMAAAARLVDMQVHTALRKPLDHFANSLNSAASIMI